jgi:hypothetical protein
MAHGHAIASLALAGSLSLALPTSAFGQAGTTPKSVAMCLPPGAPEPVACGTARAGQTIRLRIATTSLPTGPINLLFMEDAATGQAARSVSLIVPPAISRDGGYEVTLPSTLCTTGRMGNFEIQRVMSTYSEGETTRESLGTLTVAC